jgi:hypothetical protein
MDRLPPSGIRAFLRRVRWGNVGCLAAVIAAGMLIATSGHGEVPEQPTGPEDHTLDTAAQGGRPTPQGRGGRPPPKTRARRVTRKSKRARERKAGMPAEQGGRPLGKRGEGTPADRGEWPTREQAREVRPLPEATAPEQDGDWARGRNETRPAERGAESPRTGEFTPDPAR